MNVHKYWDILYRVVHLAALILLCVHTMSGGVLAALILLCVLANAHGWSL